MTDEQEAHTPHPGGRPTEYHPRFAKFAMRFNRLGATNEEISEILNISPNTLNQWSIKYPEFRDAIQTAKTKRDEEVENALYKRAIGFHRVVEKVTQQGEVVQTREELPPDTAAAFIWLKNRQPERWRDRREVEVSGAIAMTAIIAEREPPIDITLSSPELENYPGNSVQDAQHSVQDAQSSALALPPPDVKTIGINLEDCKVGERETVRMVGGPATTPPIPVQKLSREAKSTPKSKKISTKSKSRGNSKKSDPYAPA